MAVSCRSYFATFFTLETSKDQAGSPSHITWQWQAESDGAHEKQPVFVGYGRTHGRRI